MTPRRLLELDPSLLTEAQLSGLITDLARLGGWTLRYHTHTSKRSAFGYPDWTLACPERRALLFCELKSEAGRVRPEQAAWLNALREVETVRAELWRPSDWPAIVETLTGRAPRGDA